MTKLKKKTLLIILAVSIVALIVIVFRYEEKVYSGVTYRYDRFTRKVYIANADEKKPIWDETVCTNINECIQYEKKREQDDKEARSYENRRKKETEFYDQLINQYAQDVQETELQSMRNKVKKMEREKEELEKQFKDIDRK